MNWTCQLVATFNHPRYELQVPGTVFDGEEEVCRYFQLLRLAFPDQGNKIITLAADQASDTVLVEFWLTGTHLGPLNLNATLIEPTGRSFRVRKATSFASAANCDKILCKRPYCDQSAVLKALDLA